MLLYTLARLSLLRQSVTQTATNHSVRNLNPRFCHFLKVTFRIKIRIGLFVLTINAQSQRKNNNQLTELAAAKGQQSSSQIYFFLKKLIKQFFSPAHNFFFFTLYIILNEVCCLRLMCDLF